VNLSDIVGFVVFIGFIGSKFGSGIVGRDFVGFVGYVGSVVSLAIPYSAISILEIRILVLTLVVIVT
jgi:hypothetical protein